MRFRSIALVVFCAALGGCATEASMKPTETLDERTGMTVASMQEPIELVIQGHLISTSETKRSSFAYLGPVEWDRMGAISYGLWVHVAPGNDQQVVDIHSNGAVTLVLDGVPVVLTPLDAPKMSLEIYRSVVPWGQTGYFELDPELLKRMAASEKLMLSFRSNDASMIDFIPTREIRGPLTQYVQSRGITGD